MGIYDPIKTLLANINLLWIFYSNIFQGLIFYNDINSNYTPVSISSNSNHCSCLLELLNNNAILYNIVIQLAFFAGHSGILTINYKFRLFRTFGAWAYDLFYGFFAALTYNWMLRNYIPISFCFC